MKAAAYNVLWYLTLYWITLTENTLGILNSKKINARNWVFAQFLWGLKKFPVVHFQKFLPGKYHRTSSLRGPLFCHSWAQAACAPASGVQIAQSCHNWRSESYSHNQESFIQWLFMKHLQRKETSMGSPGSQKPKWYETMVW